MLIGSFLHSRTGSIIVSIVLGLGLAALFRRACNGDNCVVVKAPKSEDVNKYYYKVQESCYKYTPYMVSCDGGGGGKVAAEGFVHADKASP